MSSQRVSGRRRQPNKKYSVDAFEGLDIEDDDETITTTLPPDHANGDADLQINAHTSPDRARDVDLLDAGEIDADFNDNDTVVEQDYYDDFDSILGDSDVEEPRFHPDRKRRNPSQWGKSKGGRAAARTGFQPRGLLEPATRGSKEVQRLFMFGPAEEDQGPPLRAWFRWSGEPTLPSRNTTSGGFGGFQRSFFLPDDTVKREADEGWDWYELEGGKEAFQARQTSSSLDPVQGQSYMPSTVTLNFVMGSYKDQRLFQLPTGSSLDLNDAWRPKTSPHDTSPPLPGPRSLRTGWMLNLGDKVQSLDWLPNQEGPSQFLAVSTVTAVEEKTDKAPPYESSESPAFTSQPPYKASIQIWEFGAGEEGRVDLERRPRLRKVICTAWGDIRSLKWCPAPRKYPKHTNPTTVNLGLLAGLWGDGSVRILDIYIPAPADAACEYSLIQSVAFATRPPHTLSTCFAWLSPTGIVVGCANGSLGIWNIPSSIRQPQGDCAEPVIYASLATTYILGVVCCAPSRPHILLVTTMAGHLYMIDLSDTTSNMTFSPSICIRSTRSRIGRSILAWHDWSQMVLSADDNFTLVAFPLRRFFRQVGCTRFKSSALTVAVSPVHPFILAGGVGGEVTCNNPLRRAYESKVPIWNQIWFTHEWRAQKPNENFASAASGVEDTAMTAARPDTDGCTREDQDTGICRILEGFKSEQIKLFNTEDAFTHRENGAIYTTVYELKSSIHAVVWNPNIHVGGWAAAGMSSGLLRVEDIAS